MKMDLKEINRRGYAHVYHDPEASPEGRWNAFMHLNRSAPADDPDRVVLPLPWGRKAVFWAHDVIAGKWAEWTCPTCSALRTENEALKVLNQHLKDHEIHDHNQRRDAESERDALRSRIADTGSRR